MKKLISLFLIALMLLCGVESYAEEIDLSGMTEEQLITLINNARLELVKYHPSAMDGTVLYEDDNVRITLVGSPEIDDYDSLLLHVIVENHTDHNLTVSLRNVSCNGWAIWDAGLSVPANKKIKGDFDFMSAVTDAELESGDDVQDVEADLEYFDSDTWDDIGEPVHVVWTF